MDEDFEVIRVEVTGRDPKFTWEILGIYRARKEGMRVTEILTARTYYLGNCTKPCIIGQDLNLPYADRNGNAEYGSGNQAFVNRLVWKNGCTEAVDNPTREDAFLNVYLVRPESSFTCCRTA
jgi:hypothetical protein